MTTELTEKPVEYQTDSGDRIKLTMNMVRKYLVSGKAELTTDQELVFFMKLCQARKLNPFLKECYLVKYDRSPAAFITARSTFQNNARLADDCQGWKFGAIVQNENGDIRRSSGLVLENEKVVGGWFTAKPKGWDEPFDLEVNLSQYIKRRQDGSPTQFWTPEKQASMIAKVAEVQGLRTLWGKKTAMMYDTDEITDNGNTNQVFELPKAELVDLTPKDFDDEFSDVSGHDAWPEFWKRAVDFHAEQEPPINENQLKVDIISSSARTFRDAFMEYAKAQEATKTKGPEPEKRKKPGPKPKKKKEFDEMVQSDEYQMYELYRSEHPEIWKKAVADKEPETIAECEEICDKIAVMIRDKSEDDIPY